MPQSRNKPTQASDPMWLSLSDAKLIQFHRELYGPEAAVDVPYIQRRLNAGEANAMLSEHLQLGDSRAAVVAWCSPTLVIVAAYTDEQDAVLLLNVPVFVREQYQLRAGTRLLTINTYGKGPQMARDISPGPASTNRWTNYHPIIAEFVSNDMPAIERRKQAIDEAEWDRATRFASALLAQDLFRMRDGRPLFSMQPGKLMRFKKQPWWRRVLG